MRSTALTWILVMGCACLLGCTGAAAAENASCEFIEAGAAGKVLIGCQATAADQAATELALRSGALDFVVNQRLVTSAQERERLGKVRAQLLGELDAFVPPPGPPRRGRSQGYRSRTRMADGRIHMSGNLFVLEAHLAKRLEALGVLSKPARRLSVIVITKAPPTDPRLTGMVSGMLASHLTKLPVSLLAQDPSSGSDLSRTITAVWPSVDPGHLLGLLASADLVIEVSATHLKEEAMGTPTVAARVELKVIEVGSGLAVAGAMAQSPKRFGGRPGEANRCLEEAMNDAAAKLSPEIRRLAGAASDEQPVCVLLSKIDTKSASAAALDMKTACGQVDYNSSTAGLARFTVTCDFQQSLNLREALSKRFDGQAEVIPFGRRALVVRGK